MSNTLCWERSWHKYPNILLFILKFLPEPLRSAQYIPTTPDSCCASKVFFQQRQQRRQLETLRCYYKHPLYSGMVSVAYFSKQCLYCKIKSKKVEYSCSVDSCCCVSHALKEKNGTSFLKCMFLFCGYIFTSYNNIFMKTCHAQVVSLKPRY